MLLTMESIAGYVTGRQPCDDIPLCEYKDDIGKIYPAWTKRSVQGIFMP